MKPQNALLAAAIACAALAAPRAALAQGPGSSMYFGGHSDNPNGPTVSPYLNLLQSNSQGLNTNYQTIIRPMQDQQNALQRQGAAVQQLQQQVNSSRPSASGGRMTGHQTFFMNYGHFYPARRR